MLLLLRWIQKRRGRHQLGRNIEARETERRIQHAQREAQRRVEQVNQEVEARIQCERHDRQLTHILLLTLGKLQRTMDPLMAAQTYNNRVCPLTRLPEELLLCVLEILREDDDVVTLHCLRVVSRTFLRLLNWESPVWKDSWYRDCRWPTSRDAFFLHIIARLQYRRLLQRDGRCNNCKRWNDEHRHVSFDDCKFQQIRRRVPASGNDSLLYHKLYCYSCKSSHDICQFSWTYQQALGDQFEQQCLGQQGWVQLCEHVQIAWACIKSHIDNWQRQAPNGDWKACLDSFIIECHDASHDTRCTSLDIPTWPRARLRVSDFYKNLVFLHLEWTPYHRIDTLALTKDGKIPAPELRAIFQTFRRLGPANTLYPPFRPGTLLEMAFFSPTCHLGQRFVHYKADEDNEEGRLSPQLLPSHAPACQPPLCYRYGHGQQNNGKLEVKPFSSGGGACKQILQGLTVSYEKNILVCERTAIMNSAVKIVPTDHWLHAMDTDTYPHLRGSHIRPQCKDEHCINHYRRRKEYYCCPTWPVSDDRPREISRLV